MSKAACKKGTFMTRNGECIMIMTPKKQGWEGNTV